MTSKSNLRFDSCGSIKTPVGYLSVYELGGEIVFAEMTSMGAPNDAKSPAVAKALAELDEYFSGERREFTVPIRLEGTEFQKAVWNQVATIPFGQVMSYGQIAEAVGKPLAARAVGAAVGSNPVPLIIGCHRVMGSTGRITGYSGGDGIPTKRWLLAHENILSAD